ncbi:MAG: S9 family peptidase [Chloroflexi bacterium]|nr:S9 family peptidase [Chloroflexota bacterium]
MAAENKRRITAEDLYRLQIVSDPQISPDGKHVVFCVQTLEQATEKKHSHLWLVAADGSAPARQFTFGKQRDSHPRWSPNGRTIAFLSNRADEKQSQIYRIGLDGGEAQPITQLNGAIASFAWSPDGAQFVCQLRQKDQTAVVRDKDEQKKKLGVVDRRITRLDFRAEGAGYLPEERWHIWIIDVATGAATQLTTGETFHETNPSWSPDGRSILFTSVRADAPDLNWEQSELYLIPAQGGDIQQLPGHNGRKFEGAFSPDGQFIAYLGREQAGTWYQNDCLYVTAVDGRQTRNLSAAYDLHCGPATMTDVGSGSPATPPTWSADGQAIFTVVTQTGDQPLLRLSAAVQPPLPVIAGAGLVGAFSLDAAHTRLAYVWGALDKPGQIWLREMDSGASRLLADPNADWLADVDLGHTEEVWFPAADGRQLHGWITFPPDFDPSRQYPSILQIHGGPMGQYGRAFMHEFYYLAAQGYIVYWSNPRGGQGYGQNHLAAIAGQWGTVDYDDVMAWADYLATQPYTDPARMGVTGGSYGGYMTTLIIGRTDRFKAAVAQRVVSNLLSFYGGSDLNGTRTQSLVGVVQPPWEAFGQYWAMSPMSAIGQAKTPTLVIHGEQDKRCPPEQGEQVFVALKLLGVETELILFPEEGHELSRNGRTDRRISRLNHILRWFDQYLK